MSTRRLPAVILAIGFMFSTPRADAALIMTIDTTDLTVLTFTTTTNNSEIDLASAVDSEAGITLLGVLDGNTETFDEPFDTGTIDVFDSVSGTTRSPLTRLFVDDFAGGYTTEDLNLYNLTETFEVWMFASKQALVGSAVIDVVTGDFLTNFRAVGSTGDIVVGAPSNGLVIGQWSIVPEPSSLTLLGLGLAMLPAVRRRRSLGA